MRHQTLNRACSYAALSNLLERHGIHINDHEIILDAGIPYHMDYDPSEDQYLSGPMLQGKKWFDLYLNREGLSFHEVELPKEMAIDFLTEAEKLCMIGLKGTKGKHAYVYEHYENGLYHFMNMKYEEEKTPEHITLSSEDLSKRLDGNVRIGMIEKGIGVTKHTYHKETIETLDTYSRNLEKELDRTLNFEETKKVRTKYLEALFIDIPTMLNLIGETEIERYLVEQRTIYQQAFSSGIPCYKQVLDTGIIEKSLNQYRKVVEKYFLVPAHNTHHDNGGAARKWKVISIRAVAPCSRF